MTLKLRLGLVGFIIFASYLTGSCQDCTQYAVTFVIKGSIQLDSNSTYSIQGPSVRYLKNNENKKFDKENTYKTNLGEADSSNNEFQYFEASAESAEYDMPSYTYRRKTLPLIIVITDNNSHKSKKVKLHILKADLVFSEVWDGSSRVGSKVVVLFDVGKLNLL